MSQKPCSQALVGGSALCPPDAAARARSGPAAIWSSAVLPQPFETPLAADFALIAWRAPPICYLLHPVSQGPFDGGPVDIPQKFGRTLPIRVVEVRQAVQ